MARISITKIFTFEAAHLLKGYDGLCANIHGHSYRLEVSVYSPALSVKPGCFLHSDESDPKNGMLFDFSELKKLVNQAIIDRFDHSLVLNENIGEDLLQALQKNSLRIVRVPYQPTSENMLLDFAARLQQVLPAPIELKKLRLYETATSYTDYESEA
ncbi:MAG: 6-carboxytetrahydropterin synthase [Bacteroides sp.]|nr:6-carboxytetrahydropterin synthase [Ruminococcus flavefaciens]MCM1555092.1 6-carboxytetrahydropterin synthase [Bacteroides sp.]MCM1555457.1 6-carboxytetrahydropterin synthase [Bacteroides sp.]